MAKRTLTGLQYQQFAQKISNRLRNIEQQIKDMMLFAKGEIQLNEVIDLKTLVNKIQLHSEVILKQSGIHLKVQLPEFMEHYRIRCHEASLLGGIQNLINNAIDVTLPEVQTDPDQRAHLESNSEAANGLVSDNIIRLRISSEHLGYAKLEIIDNGPGLPAHELNQLMEPFYSTKPKGTGLGLAVVSAVVRAHNGQFTLHNRAHFKGAVAELILPILPETRSML
jgi:two-component system sensor histidine kinase FlrB